MGENHCCDMSACIALFTSIDPNVSKIETFAGKIPDTIYLLTPDGWYAVAPPPSAPPLDNEFVLVRKKDFQDGRRHRYPTRYHRSPR